MTPLDISDMAIRARVDRALSTVPADKDHALLAHVDTDGAHLSVRLRGGDHWVVEADVSRDWAGHIDGGAEVIVSW